MQDNIAYMTSEIDFNIAISGTPGTGKTTVANSLQRMLKTKLVIITELVKQGKVKFKLDEKRNCKIIDADELDKVINEKGVIIEGLISHMLDCKFVFILRCNPIVLRSRLRKRRWQEKKIRENVDAEILDSIAISASQYHKRSNIFEIDTTHQKPEQIARIIRKIIQAYIRRRHKKFSEEYKFGKINWTKDYGKMLIRNINQNSHKVMLKGGESNRKEN